MKRWPLIGVGLAVVWLFVRGVPLEATRLVEEILIGLVVGLPIAFTLRRFYKETVRAGRVFAALPALVVYVVLFVKELLTANVSVAYRVLSPSLPIEPRVFELPLRVETDLGITTIANSISLTPGTLAMDYDEERNSLYVHALAGEDRESVVRPIRRWEDYALRIFDESADPSDPVPTEAVHESVLSAEGADVEESDAEGADAEESDAERTDAEEPDAEGTDAEEPDAELPDDEESDAEGSEDEAADDEDSSVTDDDGGASDGD